MDPCVIDWPFLIRSFLVNVMIVPKRSAQSASAYQSIWTKHGSPLIEWSRRVSLALENQCNQWVEMGMCYQQPSIDQAINALVSRSDNTLTHIRCIPMYPHHAMATVTTAKQSVMRSIQRHAPHLRVTFQPIFYQDPNYINALSAVSKPYLQQPHDHILMSFHGLPIRHIRKTDPTRRHCLSNPSCCNAPVAAAHATCYRHQCFQTIYALSKHLRNLPHRIAPISIAFQSRLGKSTWLGPETISEVKRLAQSGVKRLLIICPSFVADCLETLEEIDIQLNNTFLACGGDTLVRVPSLNDHPAWIQTLSSWATKTS